MPKPKKRRCSLCQKTGHRADGCPDRLKLVGEPTKPVVIAKTLDEALRAFDGAMTTVRRAKAKRDRLAKLTAKANAAYHASLGPLAEILKALKSQP